MANILKQGNNIFKSGNNVFQAGALGQPPVFDMNPNLLSGYTDGQKVPRIYDANGNGVFLDQATISKQPVYKINEISGRPALVFDHLQAQEMLFSIARTVKTAFIVWRYVGRADRGTLLGGTGGGSQQDYFTGGNFTPVFDDTIGDSFFGSPNNASRVFANGTQVVPKSNYVKHTFFAMVTMDVGVNSLVSITRICNRQALNNSFLGCGIARIVLYDYRLSESQRKIVTDSLLQEYPSLLTQ
jgi:hypothetical protein